MPSRLLSIVACLSALIGFSKLNAQTVHLENPAVANYTDEKPDYLYFKDLTLTRKTKNGFEVEITLAGKIPSNMKDKIVYYIGFDIDNNASTGSAATTAPNFGQDIGVWIVKDKGTNRFQEETGSMVYHGKKVDITVTGLRVSDDKISFKMRSELFGAFDSFKFFGSANRTIYSGNGELVTSNVEVDQIPRKGTALFKDEKK